MASNEIPTTQQAVQLTGPDTLELNASKQVAAPGPHQILCRVEAVGLCFSDLKLLKQFTGHVRKSEVISGIDPEVLASVPSYVPGEKPGVPGHEVTVEVVAAGPSTRHQVGQRLLVQADYRWLKTQEANGALGYNFEGGLQEYVLMDERVITSPEGEAMLIPVDDTLSASAVALVEPWACVEDAYVSAERTSVLAGGEMLVAVDAGRQASGVAETFSMDAPPKTLFLVGCDALEAHGVATEVAESLDALGDRLFDDIVYFGSDATTIERLDKMLKPRGLLNVVRGEAAIDRDVSLGVGRVHYGGMRFVGTATDSAADSMRAIPATLELRPDEKVAIIGAAGPMGLMHVVRDLCCGVPGIEIVATDLDDARLAALDQVACRLSSANGVAYTSVNTQKSPQKIEGSYMALMVPVAPLVAQAVRDSLEGGIINIFAGIPATVFQEIDMNAYIEKGLYMVGTSGSTIQDMRIVLGKVQEGSLDTNLSVAAISGMAGAIDGIRAVEARSIPGKIIVYPELHDMALTMLRDLADTRPDVFAKLADGCWTRAAEEQLLAEGR